MLTIHDLRFFTVLATSDNQISAAAHLGVTRAAVSQRLSILEERLGVKVVARRRGAVRLTKAGRALRERADEILTALDSLPRDIASIRG